MRKKKIISIGLIMGLITAVNLFISFLPRAVQAENELIYASDLSGPSYNSWGFDYTGWQSSLFNYIPSIPFGASFGSYGSFGGPGEYPPFAQWPVYSYTTPSNYNDYIDNIYVFEIYPGQYIYSLSPKEEWWKTQSERYKEVCPWISLPVPPGLGEPPIRHDYFF